jgi:16S rRNA (cytosine967-C5)-methyltransferase
MPERRVHPALSPRRVAAEVLNQVDPARQFVHPVLDRSLDRTDQRQRCMDLVLGVVRNHRTLDTVIERLGQRPVERIARPLAGVLRVAVFEVLYCPLTPIHAIVNEAVEVARGLGGPRQAGFVNAVLRKITQHVVDRQGQLDQVDRPQAVPTATGHGCVFDQALLPDPAVQAAGYLSAAFSLPVWLAQDWIDRFGWGRAWQTALASNRRPGIYLRPNPLRITPADLVAALLDQGLEPTLCPDQMVRLPAVGPLSQVPGYSQGWFSVQDPCAASVVADLGPQPGWRILDLCAAPGGKTIQMAEATGDRACILATDADEARLVRLQETVSRLGLGSIRTIPSRALDDPEVTTGGFDLILVDAPCSNTGVMARRPEVRYRLQPAAIRRLAETQASLLDRAASLVRPGGRIGYSTCSIQQTEDEEGVQAFVRTHPHFRVHSQRLTLPVAGPLDHDGGYVAILERQKQEARSKKE